MADTTKEHPANPTEQTAEQVPNQVAGNTETGDGKTSKRKKGCPPPRLKVEDQNPRILQAVTNAYAATGNKERAAELTGLSDNTVRAIFRRNPEAWLEARKRLASRALELSDMALDRAAATPDKLYGLNAVIAAKTLGQMGLEQLDKQAPTVQVNVQLLTSIRSDLPSLQDEIRALEQRLAQGLTVEKSVSLE